MANTKIEIKKDIESMNSIKEFIIAQEEIAANNMRRIRDAVVGGRDFLTDITRFYNEVKSSYKKEIEEIITKSKKNNVQNVNLLKKNEKTVAVLLSTNTNLYGDIVRNSYALFKEAIQKENSDVVIIGKTGKRIFEEDQPGKPYIYFDFPDKGLDIELLKNIVMHIIKYEKVIIFHSKFETLVRQTPVAFIISESQPVTSGVDQEVKYIFEPSLEKIVEYFEKEIFSSIFEQTMQESNLSKFSYRMVSLDRTSENLKERLAKLYKKENILLHEKLNKDQVNSISMLLGWRNRL